MAKRPTLNKSQIERLATLGKLGQLVSPADAAKILGIPATRLDTYLATPAGKAVWEKARAEGRAELLTVIRRLALEGSPQAQKLLTQLTTRDDTVKPADQRVSGKELREMIGRAPSAIQNRVRCGDFLPPGADKAYRIGDLLSFLPHLWDRLSKLRDEVSKLEQLTDKVRTGREEIERQIMAETLAKKQRENATAAGKLLDADTVQTSLDNLGTELREQVAAMTEEIILKLSLPTPAVEIVRKAKANCLSRVVRAMEGART